MEFNDYFKQELSYLRTEGAEFSKKNPGLASFLSKEGQDPDVERLLEGFAFLTGRLRQQIDKELPEVSHTLVQLLWPNYVRPVPSYCIVQYEPLRESADPVMIEKGTKILSKYGASSIQSRFETSYDTEILPLEIYDLNYFTHGKKSSLELFLDMTTTGSLADINSDKLRFFMSGSRFIAKDLHMFLINFVTSIKISILDEDNEIVDTINIDSNLIKSVGYEMSQKLAPYPSNVFDGYILLQEYFCYQDKFLFFDFFGIKELKRFKEDLLLNSRKFLINFNFSKRVDADETPKKENFSLYCTPALNLFNTESVPIRKDETQNEYLVIPADIPRKNSEVFSIQNVRGWINSENSFGDYELFESFDHKDDKEYYSSKVKLSADGDNTYTYLRFASNDGLYEDLNKSNSIISVDIKCTNKNTPHDDLLVGDLNIPDPLSSVANMPFKNITIPSPSYPPAISGDFLWKIISNMSLNYLSLDNPSALKSIISSYDFVGANDIKKREETEVKLNGILSVDYKNSEIMDKGFPIRGIEVHIDLEPSNFSSLGDAYLFCSVLNEFLSLYGNINTFHRLIVDMRNEEVFTWKPKMGSRLLV